MLHISVYTHSMWSTWNVVTFLTRWLGYRSRFGRACWPLPGINHKAHHFSSLVGLVTNIFVHSQVTHRKAKKPWSFVLPPDSGRRNFPCSTVDATRRWLSAGGLEWRLRRGNGRRSRAWATRWTRSRPKTWTSRQLEGAFDRLSRKLSSSSIIACSRLGLALDFWNLWCV